MGVAVGCKGGCKGGKPGQSALETYVVSTKGNDTGEVVVRTLIGEFVEHGNNHGRKVYKKMTDTNGEPVDVYLYFWDKRDGPNLEGWWFGNQLGGSQVWSHCNSSSMTPPSTGWRIPWDGAVRPTIICSQKGGPDMSVAYEERFREAGRMAGEVMAATKASLEQARVEAGDYARREGLDAAEKLLLPQVSTLNDLMSRVGQAQVGSTGDAMRQFNQLGTNIRAAQQAVSTELTKIRQGRSQVEYGERQVVAQGKETAALQDVLTEGTAKTNAAEDSVEKAVITNEMIAAGGEDMEEVKRAVSQTEMAANEAQKAIGEARIFLNAKQASARRYESDKVREQATAELGKLQQQLQEAQNKLNPIKNVRQDFAQRAAVQKLVQEVLDKLSPAEVEVDRAEEATLMLSGESINKDALPNAEKAVARASESITTVLRFLEQKKRGAQGIAITEIEKMEERTRVSQSRLTGLKGKQKEATEVVTCEVLLKEAQEKLLSVNEAVSQAAEAEGPFLMGVEELPLEETLAAVKACEAAATTANTSVSIARMFIATKLVEAKRFSAGPSKEAQEKLKEFQKELERQTQKLMDLKKSTAQRKKAATMREAEAEVQKAEELSKEVARVAEVFEDDVKLMELSSTEIRAASDETIKAEQAANMALAEARRFVTQRQIESKGKDASAEMSTELIKYQTRLSTAQAEVGKYKKLSATVEQRLQAKKNIEDAQAKLKQAEEKVNKVSAMVDALGSEAPPEEKKKDDEAEGDEEEGAAEEKLTGPKAAEHAAAEAQVSLKAISRFVDTQTRTSQGWAKEQITTLAPQVKQVQEMLDGVVAVLRERTEKLTVDTILKESEDRVKEAENCLAKVSEAEEAFNKPAEEQTVDEASDSLNSLENALQESHTAVGAGKTFLAMKRLAAKRLSEKSTKVTTEHLAEMQGRLDAVTKRLGDAKKQMSERKLATVKREVAEKVIGVEKLVEAAKEATKALIEGGTDLAAEEMKTACEKAGSAQTEAQTSVAGVRQLLANRQKDVKVLTVDVAIQCDIEKMLEKLKVIQGELDKEKAALREQEHRFVARRLMKDATELVEELEKKLESINEVASPIASDKEDFAAVVFLAQAIEALKKHMKDGSKSAKEIFGAVSDNGIVDKGKFVSYCLALPELKSTEENETLLSEDQLQAAFSGLNGSEEVKEDDFCEHLRSRYICTTVVSMTETLGVKGGKTVRKIDTQEIVEALEEPTKDESVGLMRLKCRAEKDDKEGFITVSGNQGTIYLEPFSPHVALQKKIEMSLTELAEGTKEAARYLEQKTEELKSVRTGPLAETKMELQRIRPRVSKVQMAHVQLKKKVAEVEKRMGERMAAERKKRQEAGDRKIAAGMISDVEALMESCGAAVEVAFPAAEKLVATRAAEEDKPLQAIFEAQQGLDAAQRTIESMVAKVKEYMDQIKTIQKGPYTEARAMLVKHKVKVGALDTRCRKQMMGLAEVRKQVCGDAQQAVADVLRAHAMEKGLATDELFSKLCGGGTEVSAEQLRKFVEAIPDHGLKEAQLDHGFDSFASGVTKLAFSEMLQEYHRCVKDISITSSFAVKEGKTLRKLTPGEIVVVIEAAKVDEAAGLPRVKCRALQDEKEGWATLRGNHGTNFLEKCSKPFYLCEEEVPISLECPSSSEEVAKAQVGEVFEVLLGPVKEPTIEIQRLKGKATKDGKAGWVSLKDLQGNANLEVEKLMVVRTSIVITNSFDITEGKALRKLDVGESLEPLEEAEEDEVKGLTRVKVRAKSDGKEGWVTIRGNQGTAYVEESTRHYTCKQPVPLNTNFKTGSPQTRMLEEGEVFEAIDDPSIEKREGPNRVKGRNIASGTVGWFTLGVKSMQPWASQHRCDRATSFTDGISVKEAKALRQLVPGEMLSVLEPPSVDSASGILRVRARADKDGKVGYASVRGNGAQGAVFLKPVLGKQS